MFGQKCLAQTSVSIAPLVIGKAYFCSYGSDFRFSNLYSEQTNTDVQNPYFTFRAKKFSYRPSIDIGIQVELGFQDNKHRLSFEWASDASGTMSKSTHLTTTNTVGMPDSLTSPYKTYGNYTSYFQTSFAYNRISLRYQRRVTNKDASFVTYIVPEIALTFGKANSQSWLYDNDTVANNSSFFHNDAKLLSTEVEAYYYGGTSLLLGIGLKSDIFTNKHKYLFSIDVSYKQGFRNIVSSNQTELILDSGSKFAIVNELVASGSGLYLQLSRSFTLKKWMKN